MAILDGLCLIAACRRLDVNRTSEWNFVCLYDDGKTSDDGPFGRPNHRRRVFDAAHHGPEDRAIWLPDLGYIAFSDQTILLWQNTHQGKAKLMDTERAFDCEKRPGHLADYSCSFAFSPRFLT
jgi:hypothetical protein